LPTVPPKSFITAPDIGLIHSLPFITLNTHYTIGLISNHIKEERNLIEPILGPERLTSLYLLRRVDGALPTNPGPYFISLRRYVYLIKVRPHLR
jgi:hypothetical protein